MFNDTVLNEKFWFYFGIFLDFKLSKPVRCFFFNFWHQKPKFLFIYFYHAINNSKKIEDAEIFLEIMFIHSAIIEIIIFKNNNSLD